MMQFFLIVFFIKLFNFFITQSSVTYSVAYSVWVVKLRNFVHVADADAIYTALFFYVQTTAPSDSLLR